MALLLISSVDTINTKIDDIITVKNDGHTFSTDDLLLGNVRYIEGYTEAQVWTYLNNRMPPFGRYCRLPVPANTWTSRDNLVQVDAWNDNGTWRRITVTNDSKQFTASLLDQSDWDILGSASANPQEKQAALNKVRCNWLIHPDNQQEVVTQ